MLIHVLAANILALNDELGRVLDLYRSVEKAQVSALGQAQAKPAAASSGLDDIFGLNFSGPTPVQPVRQPAAHLFDDDVLADYSLSKPAHQAAPAFAPPAYAPPQQPSWGAPAQPQLLPNNLFAAQPAPLYAPAAAAPTHPNALSLDNLFGPAPAATQPSALSSQLASLSFQTAPVAQPKSTAYQPLVPQSFQAQPPYGLQPTPLQPVAAAPAPAPLFAQPALTPSQPLVPVSTAPASAPNLAAITIPIQSIKPSSFP